MHQITPENSCALCEGRTARIISERDRSGNYLRTVICLGCGMVYTDPRPDSDALRNYYHEHYRVEYKGVVTPKAKHLFRGVKVAFERLAYVRPHLAKTDRILDIGSGTGDFVYVLRKFGFAAEGIEPNEGYSRFSRETLDLPVQCRFVQDDMPSDRPFDAVTMFHVLEHVDNPKATFLKLRDWLAPNGKLVIEVPDVESCVSAPHRRFHQAHLFNFNHRTLAYLGALTGFKQIAATRLYHGGTIAAVFEKGLLPDQPPPPPADNAAAVIRTIRDHKPIPHFITGRPFIRLVRKELGYLFEYLSTRGLTDYRAIQEKAFRHFSRKQAG